MLARVLNGDIDCSEPVRMKANNAAIGSETGSDGVVGGWAGGFAIACGKDAEEIIRV